MNKRLYLDLDGVLADFDKYFFDNFGVEAKDIKDDVMWDHIFSIPMFFRNLPPCPGALEFFKDVKHLDPIILTACPKADYRNAAINKRDWVREHLSSDIMVLPVMGGKNKALFMHAKGDVLVDDFASNIKHWNNHGGCGIVHKHFPATLRELEDHF